MPLLKYIKQPVSSNLSGYVDYELRKIEQAFSSSAAEIEALQSSVSSLQWLSIIKPSDTATASDNTVNADPHLTLALTAGVWEIEAANVASCPVNSVSFAWNYRFSGTIGGPPVFYGVPSGVSALYDTVVGPGGTAFTMTLIATQRKTFLSKFLVDVLTAGNVSLEWAQGTSNANAVTLHKGSFIRARKLI